jgi:hypothetical protein
VQVTVTDAAGLSATRKLPFTVASAHAAPTFAFAPGSTFDGRRGGGRLILAEGSPAVELDGLSVAAAGQALRRSLGRQEVTLVAAARVGVVSHLTPAAGPTDGPPKAALSATVETTATGVRVRGTFDAVSQVLATSLRWEPFQPGTFLLFPLERNFCCLGHHVKS